MGLSMCLVRCRCRACVTAPLMVASLTRGSRKRCSVAWCAWLWVRHPSCCRRVSAGDQPTSVSLPVWRGHFLKCSQSSGVGVVARATGVFFGDVDVFAGEPSGDPGEEW